jgi:hypothetical protein
MIYRNKNNLYIYFIQFFSERADTGDDVVYLRIQYTELFKVEK